jgi:hypothetical protein
MQEKEQTNKPTESAAEQLEKKQANSQSEIREGQENSSILHDNNEGDNELPRINKQDISSTSQEEYIEDRNTKKD